MPLKPTSANREPPDAARAAAENEAARSNARASEAAGASGSSTLATRHARAPPSGVGAPFAARKRPHQTLHFPERQRTRSLRPAAAPRGGHGRGHGRRPGKRCRPREARVSRIGRRRRGAVERSGRRRVRKAALEPRIPRRARSSSHAALSAHAQPAKPHASRAKPGAKSHATKAASIAKARRRKPDQRTPRPRAPCAPIPPRRAGPPPGRIPAPRPARPPRPGSCAGTGDAPDKSSDTVARPSRTRTSMAASAAAAFTSGRLPRASRSRSHTASFTLRAVKRVLRSSAFVPWACTAMLAPRATTSSPKKGGARPRTKGGRRRRSRAPPPT